MIKIRLDGRAIELRHVLDELAHDIEVLAVFHRQFVARTLCAIFIGINTIPPLVLADVRADGFLLAVRELRRTQLAQEIDAEHIAPRPPEDAAEMLVVGIIVSTGDMLAIQLLQERDVRQRAVRKDAHDVTGTAARLRREQQALRDVIERPMHHADAERRRHLIEASILRLRRRRDDDLVDSALPQAADKERHHRVITVDRQPVAPRERLPMTRSLDGDQQAAVHVFLLHSLNIPFTGFARTFTLRIRAVRIKIRSKEILHPPNRRCFPCRRICPKISNLRGRSIHLDIHAFDHDRRDIDIEIQRGQKGATPKRIRYYSSLMDANFLVQREDFEDLP